MAVNVMFVDDEPHLLDGLRRMFRPMRQEWDMRFATSGAEALAMMAASPVNVLVTDMRMPGMNGDELLEKVRELSPQTVRIVLTGQCTRETMLRLVTLAHRYFNKPCNSEELKSAVKRACALQDVLYGPALSTLVGRLGSLPSPSGRYARILAELDKPDGSLSDVGNLVAQDVGLSAKMMQLASSCLLGLRRPPTNPMQAVRSLGAVTLKSVLLITANESQFSPKALLPYSIDNLWDHSCAVGELAGRIARAESDETNAPTAELAGLLHDVGRLMLAAQLPELYKAVLQTVETENISVTEVERRILGVNHAEVGAYLLELWGLSRDVIEVVAWHHAPDEGKVDKFGALTAVHAAEAILDPKENGPADSNHLVKLGLGDRIEKWKALLNNQDTQGKNS